jgi:hypothetical protein
MVFAEYLINFCQFDWMIYSESRPLPVHCSMLFDSDCLYSNRLPAVCCHQIRCPVFFRRPESSMPGLRLFACRRPESPMPGLRLSVFHRPESLMPGLCLSIFH